MLAGYYEPDLEGHKVLESWSGSTKMWAQLTREGVKLARCTVERCTVERLMRAHGGEGVRWVKQGQHHDP